MDLFDPQRSFGNPLRTFRQSFARPVLEKSRLFLLGGKFSSLIRGDQNPAGEKEKCEKLIKQKLTALILKRLRDGVGVSRISGLVKGSPRKCLLKNVLVQ